MILMLHNKEKNEREGKLIALHVTGALFLPYQCLL